MSEDGKNNKAICWLSFAHGITDVYSGFLTPLMPFIAVKMGFSLAIATLIVSLSQTLISTIQPLFGYFAEICKKRYFIFWGLVFASISNPFAINTNSFWSLCVLIILGNVGGSFFHPQAMGLIPYFSNKNTVKNMSIFVTLGTIGFALGPVISASIYQIWGSKYILLTSFIGIFTALLMFIFVPKLKNIETFTKKENLFLVFKNIFTNKTMTILLIIALMKTLIQSSCSIMIPFLWRDLEYSPLYIGYAMFLFLFAGGLGSLISHKFEAKFGAKFVFYSSMTITFPLMIIYAMTYKIMPVFSLSIFVLIGFLTAFAQPITIVMAQTIMPQYKSIISGIINGLTWGLVAILLTGLGFVAEKVGIIVILVILSSLPAIASILVKYLPDKAE